MKQVFIFMKLVLILIPDMKVAFLNKTFESVVLPWGKMAILPTLSLPTPPARSPVLLQPTCSLRLGTILRK